MRAGIPALWWVWLMVMCALAVVFGAAMAGWALTLGLGLWYVVLFSTVFAIPFAIPLAATARDFRA